MALLLILFCFASVVFGGDAYGEKWLAKDEVEKFDTCVTMFQGMALVPMILGTGLFEDIFDTETGRSCLESYFRFRDSMSEKSLEAWKMLLLAMDSFYSNPKNSKMEYSDAFLYAYRFMVDNDLFSKL